MDYLTRSALRRYLTTLDPADAAAFAHQFVRSTKDPLAASNNFYEAWWWLQAHPAFNHVAPGMENEPGFFDGLVMAVQRVNPMTGIIDDDDSLNTQVEIWLQNGAWAPAGDADDIYGTGEMHYHDHRLDCGGRTYEEAILKMAKLVRQHYGDY